MGCLLTIPFSRHRHHDTVTIFFSDIVGFTTISSEMPPEKVSDMLHRLFAKFDSLGESHAVHKVETIGDAWMGVTNCVRDQSTDHVKRIAEFSLKAVQAANETLINLDDPSRGHVQIRVGFHSGPVLSNVIGSAQPRYSLFGDTARTSKGLTLIAVSATCRSRPIFICLSLFFSIHRSTQRLAWRATASLVIFIARNERQCCYSTKPPSFR